MAKQLNFNTVQKVAPVIQEQKNGIVKETLRDTTITISRNLKTRLKVYLVKNNLSKQDFFKAISKQALNPGFDFSNMGKAILQGDEVVAHVILPASLMQELKTVLAKRNLRLKDYITHVIEQKVE